MTDAATRIRVYGGRVVHAVTAYPGGRLRTECFYDLGVGDVSRHGHHALHVDTAVTCRACQKELARKGDSPDIETVIDEVLDRARAKETAGSASRRMERCESRHPERGLLCTLPAGHDTHRHVGEAWTTLERLDGHVLVRTDDLAEVLAYVTGREPIAVVTNETLDRLFATLKEATEADR